MLHTVCAGMHVYVSVYASKLVTEDSMNPQAVHVGSPVTILAELSLVPWASKADFQAVLHG